MSDLTLEELKKFPKPMFQYREADRKLLHQVAIDYDDYITNIARLSDDEDLVEALVENLKGLEELIERLDSIKGFLISAK